MGRIDRNQLVDESLCEIAVSVVSLELREGSGYKTTHAVSDHVGLDCGDAVRILELLKKSADLRENKTRIE
jgi:hypothetical protein